MYSSRAEQGRDLGFFISGTKGYTRSTRKLRSHNSLWQLAWSSWESSLRLNILQGSFLHQLLQVTGEKLRLSNYRIKDQRYLTIKFPILYISFTSLYLISFLVSVCNMVNTDSYKAHKQRFFGVSSLIFNSIIGFGDQKT